MQALVAVIFDWAGTVVDHGCMAPAGMFVELFRERGVALDVRTARGPMGTHKREHLRQLCALPDVQRQWLAVHGTLPDEAAQDALFPLASRMQIEALPRHSEVIAGAVQVVDALRARGLRIGSTTGYVRAMLDVVAERAAAQGYVPDVAVAADEVREGRPAPYLLWKAAEAVGAWPAAACVNVGDTPVDMKAGRSAGMWSVGITLTGNEVGLTAHELAALSPEAREAEHQRVAGLLRAAGAHATIRGLHELPSTLEALQGRLGGGERP